MPYEQNPPPRVPSLAELFYTLENYGSPEQYDPRMYRNPPGLQGFPLQETSRMHNMRYAAEQAPSRRFNEGARATNTLVDDMYMKLMGGQPPSDYYAPIPPGPGIVQAPFQARRERGIPSGAR